MSEAAVVEEEETETETEVEESVVETEGDVSALSDADLDKKFTEQTSPEKEQESPEGTAEEKPTDKETITPKEEEPDYKALLEKEQEKNQKQTQAYRTQSQEVGTLRKELEAKVEAGSKENYEQTYEDEGAFEAQNRLTEADNAKRELENLNRQEILDTNKINILQIVPDFESKIDGIVQHLVNQKVAPENIAKFKVNPYAEDAFTLRNLAQIADLNEKVSKFTTENESLKKKPSKLINDIQKVAAQGAPITATSGKSSPQENSVHLSDREISKLSDASLDKELEDRILASQGG